MWNKRKEEDPAPRVAATPAPPAEAAREAQAAAAPAPPSRLTALEAPRGVAAIGKSVIIKGQILSREDLYLDGEMEGTVEVPEHRLTIGPHAKLSASIRAREVVVLGAVNGNVEASEKIDLRKDAKLVGDIKTGGIIIEDGAYFKGSIDIVKGVAEPVVRPATIARPVVSSYASAAASPIATTTPAGGTKR